MTPRCSKALVVMFHISLSLRVSFVLFACWVGKSLDNCYTFSSLRRHLELAETNLGMKPVKSHDWPEEEVGEVEVVFQQVRKGVAAFLAVAVLQCKAHAAHNAETTAAVEQDVLQVERTCDKRFLQKGVCALFYLFIFFKSQTLFFS